MRLEKLHEGFSVTVRTRSVVSMSRMSVESAAMLTR